MYRSSLLGLAFAATLAELSTTQNLVEGQRDALWSVFDRAMDATLAEAPVLSRVNVISETPTRQLASSSCDAPPPVVLTDRPGAAPSPPERRLRVVPLSEEVGDASVSFPVYRCADGLWTILLKDPIIEVRDEFGAEERVKLDYLKVHLKEGAPKTEAKRPAKKRQRAEQ